MSVANPVAPDVPQDSPASTFELEEASPGAHGRERVLLGQMSLGEKSAKKIAEANSDGVDPYCRIYGGVPEDVTASCCCCCCAQRNSDSDDETTARTESIIGSPENGEGREPTWTAEQNNVLTVILGKDTQFVTVEIWDSDIDKDDFLGGATIPLWQFVDGGSMDVDGEKNGVHTAPPRATRRVSRADGAAARGVHTRTHSTHACTHAPAAPTVCRRCHARPALRQRWNGGPRCRPGPIACRGGRFAAQAG
jgi:hypothetical protein